MTARGSHRARPRSLTLIGLGLLAACAAAPGTERVFSGRVVAGPYIEPEAYSAYARGSYLEASGDFAGAERAYREAVRSDRDSPAIWTRLGVIACRTDLQRALEAFRSATDGTGYSAGWAEQARCFHRHGQLDQALAAAQRALAFDPESAAANLLIADLHARNGDMERARAWLLGWALLSPQNASSSREFRERAVRLQDPLLMALARADAEPADAPAAPDALPMAVLAGDTEVARALALSGRISAAELGHRAIRMGQPRFALAQAELLLAANPKDGEALILGVWSALLLEDSARARALLGSFEGELPERSRLAGAFADLLAWYAGEGAAAAWREAYGRAQGDAEP